MAANNLTNTKQDLIAALVQRELKEKASLAPFVMDLSSLAVKGSKSVSVPKLSSFTVQSRTLGSAASPNAALTDAKDTINLDKHKIVLFSYDSHDEQQSTIDYMASAIGRASSAHGRQVNSDILTMWSSVAGLNVNGGTPADITADDILDMREFLIKNFADMTKTALIIAADQEKAMLKLAEFSRYDYRGGGTAPVVNGQIGFVYGVPVIINQQVAAQQAFMVNMEGSGYAFQQAPSVAEQSDISYGTGGKLVAVDCDYGVGGLQLGEGTAASGKSPLIAKLAD
ncbi:MAG TPA: P22 phage major capsid protein family protein [Nitrosomonas sp.]|nr:P22 phage major capsid protein family protein [Nitrosomonas sp.]